ncbi:MAG: hypothetical protein LBD77_09910 [Bifidobacteriaceae bacterium]|jgi:hypothetical protein|nr:hypothetical protein [Bifidobacteriaceae bacterium]
MPTSTFFVSGDPTKARATVDQLLAERGFSLSYSDAFTGTAERGSKAGTVAFGALAGSSNQHLKVNLNFASDPYGNTAITIAAATTGAAAGLIGVNRAKKAYGELFAAIRATFAQAGVLLGEQAI